MNPLTNIRNLQKINERELEMGLTGTSSSWHNEYKDSAWLFVGGLPYDLSEGDVLCVFSQYGEIVNINLVRDKDTGKFKGFGFICYEDQRSTILAVDNLNGIKLLSRTIRVDHVKDYKPPKEFGDEDSVTQKLRSEGCAPSMAQETSEEEDDYVVPVKKIHKAKKKKEKKSGKKEKKRKRMLNSDSETDDSPDSHSESAPVKKEKVDVGYDKYMHSKSSKTASERLSDGPDRHNEGRSRDSPRIASRNEGNTGRYARGDKDYSYEKRHSRSPNKEHKRHQEEQRGDMQQYKNAKGNTYSRHDNREDSRHGSDRRNYDNSDHYSRKDSYRRQDRDKYRDKYRR